MNIEKAMEFIVAQQAQFEANFGKAEARFARSEARFAQAEKHLDRMERLVARKTTISSPSLPDTVCRCGRIFGGTRR